MHTARVWVADYLVHGYQVQSLAFANRDLVAQNEGYAMRLHTCPALRATIKPARAAWLKSSAPYPLISAEALYQVVDPVYAQIGAQYG